MIGRPIGSRIIDLGDYRSAAKTKSRVDPAAATIEPPTGELLADKRYPALVRQCNLYINLAFSKRSTHPGWCSPSDGWLAGQLGVSKTAVKHNRTRLAALERIEIESQTGPKRTDKVSPLPRRTGKLRDRRKAALLAAWTCSKLDLPYRLQWLLSEISWQGEPVERTLVELAGITGVKHRQAVWRAVQVNFQRGRLTVMPVGAGPCHGSRYVVQGIFRSGAGTARTGPIIDEEGQWIETPGGDDDDGPIDLEEWIAAIRDPRRRRQRQ